MQTALWEVMFHHIRRSLGNPARAIQKRFDDELIELLLRFKWWDRSIDEINRLIPILTCSDLDKVKAEIKKQLD
ncbi:MAG: hypothetical protein V8S08_08795 [Lachnoclostridium sp.]